MHDITSVKATAKMIYLRYRCGKFSIANTWRGRGMALRVRFGLAPNGVNKLCERAIFKSHQILKDFMI